MKQLLRILTIMLMFGGTAACSLADNDLLGSSPDADARAAAMETENRADLEDALAALAQLVDDSEEATKIRDAADTVKDAAYKLPRYDRKRVLALREADKARNHADELSVQLSLGGAADRAVLADRLSFLAKWTRGKKDNLPKQIQQIRLWADDVITAAAKLPGRDEDRLKAEIAVRQALQLADRLEDKYTSAKQRDADLAAAAAPRAAPASGPTVVTDSR